MEVSPFLVDEFVKGNVVPFVGAGLSMGSGLKSWTQLVKPLADDLEIAWPDNPEFMTAEYLLRILDDFQASYGRYYLLSRVREELVHRQAVPSLNHSLLVNLPVSTIFTTNYDRLIERAFEKHHMAYGLIAGPSQLGLLDNSVTQIVKLCGDFNFTDPNGIFVTGSDFNGYFERNRLLVDFIRVTIASSTILFIGYSLSDPIINRLWEEIRIQFGKNGRAFLICFNKEEAELRRYISKDIHPINFEVPYKNYDLQLKLWLTKLSMSVHKQLETKNGPSCLVLQNVDGSASKLSIEQLAESLKELEGLQEALQEIKTVQYELVESLSSLKSWARLANLSAARSNQQTVSMLEKLSHGLDQNLSMSDQIELTFQIIPGLLSYKHHFGVSQSIELEKLWAELKERLGLQ